ncbi:unnamed protein product [Fraxinus pennsylvanica]|uniref:Uncharacterized protein n=1 Tax=Fraxinus pennsylvanica TaxID=56036 RepID=A0AAD1YTH8_9LAMI|nr:unnamed protein product [Fraxinus pennsylvanica]
MPGYNPDTIWSWPLLSYGKFFEYITRSCTKSKRKTCYPDEFESAAIPHQLYRDTRFLHNLTGSVVMDISLKLIHIAFFLFLLICLLLDVFKERRNHGDKQSLKSEFGQQSTTLASLVAVYSLCKTSRKHRTWPFVLILWWFISSICNLLLASVYILSLYKSIEISNFLPEANIIDFGSLPLSILLCFNALPNNSAHKHDMTTQPLLQKELEKQEKHINAFSDAGIWNQLTFRWLNPLFKKGCGEKIELEHIPSIPLSETADEASSLLEQFLRKQKTETILLPNANFRQRN